MDADASRRVVVFTDGADAQPRFAFFEEEPHRYDRDKGQIRQQVVPRKDVAEHGNVLEKRDLQRREYKARKRCGHAFVTADRIQDKDRAACGDQVHRNARQHDIRLHLQGEIRHDERDEHSRNEAAQHADEEASAVRAAEHARERGKEHDALQTDVDDARTVGDEASERRKQDRRGQPQRRINEINGKYRLQNIRHSPRLLPAAAWMPKLAVPRAFRRPRRCICV